MVFDGSLMRGARGVLRDKMLASPTVKTILGDGESIVVTTENFLEEIACDGSQLVGPTACLHNEHVKILKALDTVTQNQAAISRQIDESEKRVVKRIEEAEENMVAEVRKLKTFMDRIFEGSPEQ